MYNYILVFVTLTCLLNTAKSQEMADSYLIEYDLLINAKDLVKPTWNSSVDFKKNEEGRPKLNIILDVPDNYKIIGQKELLPAKPHRYEIAIKKSPSQYEVKILGPENSTVPATLNVQIIPQLNRIIFADSCIDLIDVSFNKTSIDPIWLEISCQKNLDNSLIVTPILILGTSDEAAKLKSIRIKEKDIKSILNFNFALKEVFEKEKEKEIEKEKLTTLFLTNSLNHSKSEVDYPSIGFKGMYTFNLQKVKLVNILLADFIALKSKAFKDRHYLMLSQEFYSPYVVLKYFAHRIEGLISLNLLFMNNLNSKSVHPFNFSTGIKYSFDKFSLTNQISLLSTLKNNRMYQMIASYNFNFLQVDFGLTKNHFKNIDGKQNYHKWSLAIGKSL